jgi:hypothetical protein
VKEVKLVSLVDLTFRDGQVKAQRPGVQKELEKLLNAGSWRIEGTGGSSLEDAFVILVRER